MPYALTKLGLATIPPITLVAARDAIAAAALWSYVLAVRCKMPPWRQFVVPALVQGCLACLVPHTLIALVNNPSTALWRRFELHHPPVRVPARVGLEPA